MDKTIRFMESVLTKFEMKRKFRNEELEQLYQHPVFVSIISFTNVISKYLFLAGIGGLTIALMIFLFSIRAY